MACIVHSSISKLSRASSGGDPRVPGRSHWSLGMSYLKQKLSLPLVKYSVFGIASLLWMFGLVDQLYESAAMMKYLLLSLLMVAIAFI
jgi:hypothetical protein